MIIVATRVHPIIPSGGLQRASRSPSQHILATLTPPVEIASLSSLSPDCGADTSSPDGLLQCFFFARHQNQKVELQRGTLDLDSLLF